MRDDYQPHDKDAERPDISSPKAKNFSGEIRRDFYRICTSPATSEEVLELLEKHTECSLPDGERDAAVAIISAPYCPSNVYSIIMRLGDYYPLREFALSAREGFTFRDKQTLRWGLIYAMIATSSTGLISAELGFTELPVAGVLARLRKPNMATYDTKQGRFIEGVEAGGLSCRFWQLESHAGTLDDMQIIKNYWKVSGSARGVHFPAPPYVLGKVKMNLDRPCRQWPDQDAVLCSGIRIR